MTLWQKINQRAYGLRYRLLTRRALRRGRCAAPALEAARRAGRPDEVPPDAGSGPILHVAWGRIGDSIVQTGALKHFRHAFPGQPIVHLGRAETAPVVAPHVDRFIAFDAVAWHRDAAARRALAAQLAGTFDAVVSDAHLFYGGAFELGPLLTAVDARVKLIYRGYDVGPGLAPRFRAPDGFEVIPARARSGASLDSRHVLHDAGHILQFATQRLRGLPYPVTDLEPDLRMTQPTAEQRATFAGAVAWQPFSNNSKKDFPGAAWRDVLKAFPDRRFIALGIDPEPIEALGLRNVINLAGQTDLQTAAQVIQACEAFVGPDSGLTHMAAALDRPTVCVAQSSNLGYFFPYPAVARRQRLQVVDNPEYRACAGCFMTCAHESILRTKRRGALCLRTLPATAVVAGLERALRLEAPEPPEPAPSGPATAVTPSP